MAIIFNQTYSSESMADIYRDVNEAFSVDYNKLLKEELREDQSVQVVFLFENTKKSVLLDRIYDVMNIQDIEEDIDFAVEHIEKTGDVQIDKHGFFDGEFTIVMSIVEENEE